MIPSLVFAYSSMQAPSFFKAYYGQGKIEWLISAGLFLGMVNHWIFSTQYIRTSKTLPLMITQAEFAKVQCTEEGIDIGKIQDTLAKHDVNVSCLGSEKFKTLHALDAAIEQNSKEINDVRRKLLYLDALALSLFFAIEFVYLYVWVGYQADENNTRQIRLVITCGILELLVWALITVSLIASVVLMERAIGKSTIGVANKKFVYYHIFGFALWLVCYAV